MQLGIRLLAYYFVLMKKALCLIAVLCSISMAAQDYIKKRVVSEKGIPLAFSTVMLKPSNKGVIANEDGFFILPRGPLYEADSVHISHIGYYKKAIPAAELENTPIISLLEEKNELAQVLIKSDTEKQWVETIFKAFQNRRDSQLEQKLSGRLSLRSYEGDSPVEVLEGEAALKMKNTGMPEKIEFAYLNTNMDTGNVASFYSIHTSKLIEQIGLFERSEVSGWPLHPGRLGKRTIAKEFQIDLIKYNVANEISEFELISKTDEYLSAKVWINDKQNQILKYQIFGKNLRAVPVVSIIRGKKIDNFDAYLEFEFNAENQRLNFLVWDLNFTIGNTQHINSSIRLFVSDDTLQEPIFINDKFYHDYAMAAMLPPRSEKLDTEFTLGRSKKDQEALQSLQDMSSKLETSLVFWDANTPFDLENIRVKRAKSRGGFSTVYGANTAVLNQKYNLSFNGVVFLNSKQQYEVKAFFDRAVSSIPDISEPSFKLLVNLLFDEYAYAAGRIAADARNEEINSLKKIEKEELDLRENRLLINSKGGNDLTFLLQQNRTNYEIHGIDRFLQLNERSMDSVLFENFDKHIDPESPVQLALAHLIVGEYNRSLGIIKAMPEKNGAALYIKALNMYFKNLCDNYKESLTEAEKAGFPVPELAKSLCQ